MEVTERKNSPLSLLEQVSLTAVLESPIGEARNRKQKVEMLRVAIPIPASGSTVFFRSPETKQATDTRAVWTAPHRTEQRLGGRLFAALAGRMVEGPQVSCSTHLLSYLVYVPKDWKVRHCTFEWFIHFRQEPSQ